MVQSPNSSERYSLAKLATLFAVGFGIAFGLCAVSVVTDGLGSEKALPFLIRIALIAEGICLLGLLAVGVVAIFRSLRGE